MTVLLIALLTACGVVAAGVFGFSRGSAAAYQAMQLVGACPTCGWTHGDWPINAD